MVTRYQSFLKSYEIIISYKTKKRNIILQNIIVFEKFCGIIFMQKSPETQGFLFALLLPLAHGFVTSTELVNKPCFVVVIFYILP